MSFRSVLSGSLFVLVACDSTQEPGTTPTEPEVQGEGCEPYLDCVAAVQPAGLGAAEAGFTTAATSGTIKSVDTNFGNLLNIFTLLTILRWNLLGDTMRIMRKNSYKALAKVLQKNYGK